MIKIKKKKEKGGWGECLQDKHIECPACACLRLPACLGYLFPRGPFINQKDNKRVKIPCPFIYSFFLRHLA